ncbi:PadR family transcriptional regulator [Thermococci archaeon]|nr:MAG: PadR family transcriptional regulator [Thermococci archaeon]RLF87570.1 MAG: PadR family transcriptional regulator [Thermococci archaeon]
MFGNPKEKALKKLRKELRAGLYSYIVLSLLKNNGEMHGYSIRKEFEKISDGKIVPSEGALYDLLKSLERYKLIEGFWAEVGGRPRKYYRITPLGMEVFKELENEIGLINRTLKEVRGEKYEWS